MVQAGRVVLYTPCQLPDLMSGCIEPGRSGVPLCEFVIVRLTEGSAAMAPCWFKTLCAVSHDQSLAFLSHHIFRIYSFWRLASAVLPVEICKASKLCSQRDSVSREHPLRLQMPS